MDISWTVQVHTAQDPQLREAVADLQGRLSTLAQGLGEQKVAQLERDDGEDFTGILAQDRHSEATLGYAQIRHTPGEDPVAFAELISDNGLSRDDRRTLEDDLLTAVSSQVAELGGGRLFVWCHDVEDPNQTPPARAGFRIQRRLLVLRHPLDSPLPSVSLPAGVEIEPFTETRRDALLELNNAAFADHPENGGWDFTELDRRLSQSWVDPEGIFLAVSTKTDQLLGFHWTKQHPDPSPPLGEVYILAVSPDAQGMGLGKALLNLGMGHLKERSASVILYVDAAQEVAVSLYQSAGFQIERVEVCYEDTIPPR